MAEEKGTPKIAKIEVDRDACISVASCVDISPAVFELDDEGKADDFPARWVISFDREHSTYRMITKFHDNSSITSVMSGAFGAKAVLTGDPDIPFYVTDIYENENNSNLVLEKAHFAIVKQSLVTAFLVTDVFSCDIYFKKIVF